jgi:hypothetical protein
MRYARFTGFVAVAALMAGVSSADVVVNYTLDAGGNNTDPLNGLAARATWALSGTTLTILLENTSTGVPDSFDVSDSLLVSLGFNLLHGVSIVSGDSATIGAGSVGLGLWGARVAGDSVAEEWIWTNDFGGDLMEPFAQVISTSNGQGGGDVTTFDGILNGNVGGPFGGIAADPPHRAVPGQQPAVSDSIFFSLTLSDILSDDDLEEIALKAIVEFGSDARYLKVPGPAAIALFGLAGLTRSRRRR